MNRIFIEDVSSGFQAYKNIILNDSSSQLDKKLVTLMD